MTKYRVAVLASGDGTNLQALIDGIHCRGLAELVVTASDNEKARALARADAAGIPALALPPQAGEGRRAYHRRLAGAVKAFRPDLVVLAGYMRLLPPDFVAAMPPIINVHPSLLPAFPGLDAPGQAIAHGVKVTGCTVHLVDEGMDTGPILIQLALAIQPGESAESLHSRIKILEHQALVRAVAAFAQGRVGIREGIVCIKEDSRDED